MAGELILVVDDEEVVRELVRHCLVREGFKVITTADAYGAFDLIARLKPDLIILDILLPGLDGIEFCRKLRMKNEVPVIFLSAKGDSSDIILGLGVGGDDYIVKPFVPGELVARVKARLRRLKPGEETAAGREPKMLKYRGLEIDLEGHAVLVDGSAVALAPKEFEILALLAKNPNRVFKNEQLLDLIWQSKDFADNRTLMVHISRLRKKIEKDPNNPAYIQTVRGVGYKFSAF
ncbi:MAG: response regulator transcription factor [Pelotomaculum sp.]|uniref:Stage 0 sporulation protein A homolog n=1 Tax=Pelotomaculum thermopropionicum (strain DSM 13744 / JCM 10971 / SI) TaxID=370438 RepID=A5D5Z5_PELTS|nr:response regulator transcription factor [Pelotomaculum sp.]BAF58324.1 response regulator [Pelotomaculum thermopropionicum SI]